MSSKFSSNWNSDQIANSEKGFSRFRAALKSPEPLRPKLDAATRQIQIEISKLNSVSTRLKEKDNMIFQRVILSIQRHDSQHANMLANELSEIRKMTRLVTQSKLAFEQIELRINTIKDLGDIANSLSPAMGIIRSVAPGLINVVPEAQGEMGEISELLSSILVDAGQMSNASINFEVANDEAEKVLAEAAAVAEQNMRERFPDLPQSMQASYEGQEQEEGEAT